MTELTNFFDPGEWAILSILSAVLAIGLWRWSTAHFLRRSGVEPSRLYFTTFLVSVILDLIVAVWLAFRTRRRPPVGVLFHGISLISTVFFLFALYSNRQL